jgi:hypothetical protein
LDPDGKVLKPFHPICVYAFDRWYNPPKSSLKRQPPTQSWPDLASWIQQVWIAEQEEEEE